MGGAGRGGAGRGDAWVDAKAFVYAPKIGPTVSAMPFPTMTMPSLHTMQRVHG